MNKFIVNNIFNSSLSRGAILLLLYLKTIKQWSQSQSELGEAVGISRETTNSALKELKEAGLVEVKRPIYGDSRILKIRVKEATK